MMEFSGVHTALEEAVVEGVFPGAVLLVGRKNNVLFHRAYGSKSLRPVKTPMTTNTVFDLSSLTKPIATTTALMLMVGEGRVRPDDRYSDFFQEFMCGEKEGITFRHLLSHCSGLPAWKPFYQELENDGTGTRPRERGKDLVWKRIQEEKLVSCPGESTLYSDLGFILLGEAVERLNGCGLDEYCRTRIFDPMGLHSTFFVKLASQSSMGETFLDRFAPTEECPRRRKVLLGEVHDDNAYAMGGVAGHAGLFSCTSDLHLFLTLLRLCYDGESPLVPRPIVRDFLTRNRAVESSSYAMGWDTPAPQNSSSGHYFSCHSVGHLGFTGTSIWWDLDRDLHVILLSNRVHPSRENEKIRAFRPLLHDLVLEAVLR